MRLGWLEIVLILILVLLLFGANKFPSLMKNLAEGIKVFKKEDKAKPQASPKRKEKKGKRK